MGNSLHPYISNVTTEFFNTYCFHVLHMYSLIDNCPPWFVNVTIKPHYENEDLILLSDIPEYSGVDEEEDDNVLRPDGKLILKKKKIVYVLEMSVPWISNREKKK